MNSRQQSAITPFLFRRRGAPAALNRNALRRGRRLYNCARMKFATQHKTFRFERKQRRVNFRLLQNQCICKLANRDWSASLYATANQFANRIGSFPSLAVHRNRQNQFRLTGSVRIDRPEHWIPLRSDVKSSSRGIAALQRHQGTGRPILSYKCWEELLCVFAPASLNLLRRHYA